MQSFSDRADVGHFIQGRRVPGTGTRTQPIFNPATGKEARTLHLGDVADVDAAVAGAKKAFVAGVRRRRSGAHASCCVFWS
jgi:malonate-semialdehyde dehydrogenase (acetylating)/methylmalonate-semialdehyde dehydrogenase